MSKIILNSEPWFAERCPFCIGYNQCFFTKTECVCISGYYDSLNFDFKKCKYCTTNDKCLF